MSTTYTCTMQMRCLKKHTCFACGCVYSYGLTRKVTGQAASEHQARAAAHRSYRDTMRTAVDVQPCPECGALQPEMIAQRRLAWYGGILVAGVIGMVLFTWACGLSSASRRGPQSSDYVIPVGLAALVAAAIVATEFWNPNANRDRNRALAEERVSRGVLTLHATGRGAPATVLDSHRSRTSSLCALASMGAPVVVLAPAIGLFLRGSPPRASLIAAGVLLGIVVVALIILNRRLRAQGGTAEVISDDGETIDPRTFSLEPMGPMQTRLRAEKVGTDRAYEVHRIEARGLFPVGKRTRLGFMASVLDVTDADIQGNGSYPVLCTLENFQEPDSICYRDRSDVGEVEPNYGWHDWNGVLNIVPETLVPPRSGRRRLRVWINAFDIDQEPVVRHGYWIENEPLVHWSHTLDWTFTGDGYEEQTEKRELGEELIVKLAVAMGFVDGAFQESEGQVVKTWITRRLEPLGEETRERRKNRFNVAFREAYAAGQSGRSGAAKIMEALKEIGNPNLSLEAVELCLDVMSADSNADTKELRAVHEVARRLDVDRDRFQLAMDKRLVGGAVPDRAVDFHRILHIDPSWGPEEIRTHLNREYSKWNSRAESLTDPEKRAQAEKMLEIVAAARKALVA